MTSRRACAWSVAVMTLLIAPVIDEIEAHAQTTGFAVNRFEPAERGAGRFFIVDALDLRGHLRPAIGATFDYAYKPLVVQDASGREQFALVRHQAFVHLGGSLVLIDRLRVGLSVPLAMYQDGESGFVRGEELRGATAPAFGDLRFAFDARLVGRRHDAFTLAAGVRAWAPTGLRSQFTSDGTFRVSPQILASGDLGSIFTWAARLAVVFRARDDAYAGSPLGNELAGQLGLGLRALNDRLLIGPELWTSSILSGGAFFGERETAANAIAGMHYDITRGLRVAMGIGTGLTRGYGSPLFRGLLSIEWAPPFDEPTFDRDGDGIRDDVDACPDTKGMPDGDPSVNGCPLAPRVPLEDTDNDGISDMDDACPGVVGVRTSDPMTNGCPPSTAPRPLAVVTKAEIKIGEQLRFATDSAELLLAESEAVLSAVKRILDEHPEIQRVRIEGHTDATGDATYNEALSARRATAVLAWLTSHGVDAIRLESAGFGSRRPIDTNETETGRANNRRVVFTIVERK
jgi:OOP family OmpA-OmpF porin